MIARLTLGVVLLSALPLGANRPMWWTLLAIIVLFLFAAQVMMDARVGLDRAARKCLPIGVFFLLVLAWAMVQSLWPVSPSLSHPIWQFVDTPRAFLSADPIGGLHHVMRLATYAMIFWIALSHSKRADDANRFMIWIAVWITLMSTFGIVAAFTSHNPLLGDFASSSVSSSFVNRNNFATYAAIGLLANLTLYHHQTINISGAGHRQLRNFLEDFFQTNWIFASGVLLCLAGILLSQSRAGLAASGLGLAALFLTRGSGSARASLFATLFVVALIGFSISALSAGVLQRVFVHSGEDARFIIYPLVVEGITDRPILGHGLGGFQDAFRVYITPDLAGAEIDLAHSSYLENAFELGLPAAIVFFGCLLSIILVILRATRKRRQNKRFARFAFSVSVACGFHALFDFSMQIPAIAALFAFILGLGWAQAFSRSDVRNPEI